MAARPSPFKAVVPGPAAAAVANAEAALGARLDTQRVVLNGIALAVAVAVLRSSWLTTLGNWLDYKTGSNMCGVSVVSVVYLALVLFAANVAAELWRWLNPPVLSDKALAELTPKQRRLLGITSPAALAVPVAVKPVVQPVPPRSPAATASSPAAPRPVPVSPTESAARLLAMRATSPQSPSSVSAGGGGAAFSPAGAGPTPSKLVYWSPGSPSAFTTPATSPSPSKRPPYSTFGSPAADTSVNYSVDAYRQATAYSQQLQQQQQQQQVSPQHAVQRLYQDAPFFYQNAPQQVNVTTGVVSNERDSMAVQNEYADNLLREKKLANSIGAKTDNLRAWIGDRIFLPLVQRMDAIDREFLQQGFQSTTCAVGVWDPTALPPAPGTGPLVPQTMTLAQLAQSFSNNPLVQERLRIEKYLQIPKAPATQRDYIYSRIKKLAEGMMLPAYRWNAGGPYKDKEWTEDLPSDAQIVMHLFACFFDEQIPASGDATSFQRPFTSRFFVPMDGDVAGLSSSLEPARIRQTSVKPPHFNLLVQQKKTWYVRQGRNNLFQALVLFVHYYESETSGYIGGCDLAGRSIGLIPAINDE